MITGPLRFRAVVLLVAAGACACNDRSGSTADHDHEIEDARWLPFEQAIRELTYPGEREMVQSALSKTGLGR